MAAAATTEPLKPWRASECAPVEPTSGIVSELARCTMKHDRAVQAVAALIVERV